LGKVFGVVTLDARPVPKGMVIFANREKGVYMTAPLDAQGKYEVQMAQGFGLPLGNYQIAVSPPLPQPGMPGAPPVTMPPDGGHPIPAQYRQIETSGLTLTVSAGENLRDIALLSSPSRKLP
jgi:hypothetical protein